MKLWTGLFLILMGLSCKTTNFKGGVARSQTNGTLTPNVTSENTVTGQTENPIDPVTGKPIEGTSGSQEIPSASNPTANPETPTGATDPGTADTPKEPESPTNPANPIDPFVEITKLGVNFEDRPGTDNDFNDAVLCFKGAFKINSAQLISLKKQELVATTSSISLCKHNIEVKIFDKSKKLTSSKVYDTKTKNEVNMKLEEGDELEINMIPYEGCGVGQVRSMRDGNYAKILIDQCHTTGQ